MMGVYKITNVVNGKFYIGSSLDIEKRFMFHFVPSESKHSQQFADDIAKYGKKSFRLEVLEEHSDESTMRNREMYFIQNMHPHYNVIVKGGKRSADFCDKVSEGTTQWWKTLPKETRDKIINNNLKPPPIGHPVSKETREKLRLANLGKKQSEESKRKQRESLKEYFKTHSRKGQPPHNKRAIECDGVRYETMKSCCEAIGCCYSAIRRAVKRSECGGGIVIVKGHKVRFVV